MTQMVSIVVASKNRRELLLQLLDALRLQEVPDDVEVEIIVVDDGSTPAYVSSELAGARLVRCEGVGPARARNRGIGVATGDVVFFTDDDVIVDRGWLAAGLAYLEAHPGEAGVTGETSSPTYDPLYEHSVEDHDGGSFLTCNVAYRRVALLAVGGFDRLLPHAAHEDRDLAWRIISHEGPVGFCREMKVTHPGRPFRYRTWVKRGRLAVDDWLLMSRYPERRATKYGIRWSPLIGGIRRWMSIGVQAKAWSSPLRTLRWFFLAGGQLSWILIVTIRRWSSVRERDMRAVPGLRVDGLRIAYVGPSPDPTAGGAPGVAGLIVRELLERGHGVDCFVVASVEDAEPTALGEHEGLTYVLEQSGFRFMKWYSRSRLTKMASSQVFTAVHRRRLARRLAGLHRASPYDVVYQFSTFESFGIPRHLPIPVISQPSVHAQGELRWLVAKGARNFSDDGIVRRRLVSLWLRARARRQARDAQRVTAIFALSRVFAHHISEDYGVPENKIFVVPNCIDVSEYKISQTFSESVVSVGRIAVRKGLEDVVSLAERYPEGPPISVFGSPSLWSDYGRLLRECRSPRLHIEGHRPRSEVVDAMAGATAVLQMSRYEPFGLTVAEALAVGTPVIVTREVGAAEGLPSNVCRVVAPGDVAAIEENLASFLKLSLEERQALAIDCRAVALLHFSPQKIADDWERAAQLVLESFKLKRFGTNS